MKIQNENFARLFEQKISVLENKDLTQERKDEFSRVIEAKIRAKKETIFDITPDTPVLSVPIATIAPTIITLEIAFVTPIKGLCNAGVTDQTT